MEKTSFAGLYKWNQKDTKQETIVQMANNSEKIDKILDEHNEQIEHVNKTIVAVDEKATIAKEISENAKVESSAAVRIAGLAETNAADALEKATESKTTAETVQEQFERVVAEAGSNNPEVVQARGGEVNLNARLNGFTQQLAETVEYADSSFSGLSSRKKRRQPLVSITVDDGAMADYTKLKPLLEEKGITAGLGIITSRVGTRYDGADYMTYEQIREMEKMGCEIMSHTHSHPNLRNLTEAQIDNEVYRGYIELIRNGFHPKGLIYPYNADNELTHKVVRRYFNAGYTKTEVTHQGRNYIDFNNQKIKRVALGSYFDQINYWEDYPKDASSLEYYKWRVDEAIQNNNWLVFVVHSGSTSDTQWEYFRQVIDYIKSKGVPILNPSDAFDIYGNIIDIRGDSGTFIVDAEGSVTGSGGLGEGSYKVLPVSDLGTYNATTKLSAFPTDKVITFHLNAPNAAGTPKNEPGIITNYRLGDSLQYQYGKQEFRPYGKSEVWIRSAKADGEWSAWKEVGVNPAPIKNSHPSSHGIQYYPVNEVTITYFDINGKGNYPVESGTITTVRVSEDNWSYQVLADSATDDMYRRRWNSGNWRPWKKITV